VAAFNDAVADLDPATVDTGVSLTAERGAYRVEHVLKNAPGGSLRVDLEVRKNSLRMSCRTDRSPEPSEPANVTVTMDYADAAAMSRGELDAADALAAGRIRVRGDLALLVASQALLAAASARLGPLRRETTS
jgi:hypothetical protein